MTPWLEELASWRSGNHLRPAVTLPGRNAPSVAPDPLADLLDADEWHDESLAPFLTRETYPKAATRLMRICTGRPVAGFASFIEAMRTDDPNIAAIRAATACGINTAMPDRFGLSDLARSHDPRARVALALIGRPVDAWNAMDRATRAAYTLHRLAAMMFC